MHLISTVVLIAPRFQCDGGEAPAVRNTIVGLKSARLAVALPANKNMWCETYYFA